MQSILESFVLVAVTEMGDKTQLLALVLSARFKKPWIVFAGIFVATIANHLGAAWIGVWVLKMVSPELMKWLLAALFFGFAAWALIPDQAEEEKLVSNHGVFITTVVTFFLAEMGDKTQLATVAMAAKFNTVVGVTLGSTMGMLVSDGMAVFFGDRVLQRVSMRVIRIVSALLFVALGIAVLIR